MIAQNQKGAMLNLFGQKLCGLARKGIVKVRAPDPLDFMVFVLQFRNIVNLVAGFDQGLQVRFGFELTGIDDHGPLLGLQRLGAFFNDSFGPGGRLFFGECI